MNSTTATTPQKQPHRPFPVYVSTGHRGERSKSPTKSDNHPYAIKTTASAVLTQSNSTGFSAYTHSYIPPSPSPNSKHRYSKSDLNLVSKGSISDSKSTASPRPLPIPPTIDQPSKPVRSGFSDAELRPLSLRTRADTLPSTPPVSSPVKVDDLPSNPKVRTTTQLASYLITALRAKSGETLPVPLPVARDIAMFVKETRMNGRMFLRLTEDDLEL